MKRLFVIVPAIVLAVCMLNSFVLKETEAGKQTTEGAKLATGFTLRNLSLIDPFAIFSVANKNRLKPVKMVIRSTNGGQTWQDITQELPKNWEQVQKKLVTNAVESGGVIIATSGRGIKRSTDNGEHWQWVISEGGVGIVVERIRGGFAAITYNTATKSRRIRISLDAGKTWQAIDQGLPPSMFITSIKQVGNYLVCGHSDGIFQSANMGKTWTRVHPGIGKNVFRIAVSGNIIYAVAGAAGC